MTMRYHGRLNKWNTDRGFGFIVADDGGAELFVHISSFARNAPSPVVGEALSFEVVPDRDGKNRAVQVLRPGEQMVKATLKPVGMRRGASRDAAPGWTTGKAFVVLLICVVAVVGYNRFMTKAARYDSLPHVLAPVVAPVADAAALLSPAKLAVPADFKCDGRNMCSQMISCREATLFLQNCPGMKMDGNGDGVPCEQQWCSQ
jgi:cold shock CspA family protein